MWVATDLDDVLPRLGLAAIASSNAFTRISRCAYMIAAAIYMAEGKVSLDDWGHVDVVVG